MEKLKISIDGIEKKIEYTERFSKGIFTVMETKAVKRNCELLKIDVGTPGSDLQLLQKITKLDKVALLTMRLSNDYFQYIIMSYTERDDFNRFLTEVPPEIHESLKTVYNLTKMNTLEDLDFLGGPLDDKN